MTRIPATLLCLMLGACNHPSVWLEPERAAYPVPLSPPIYPLQVRKVCYNKWGKELTSEDMRARDYRFIYGDHCYEVGADQRAASAGRRAFR